MRRPRAGSAALLGVGLALTFGVGAPNGARQAARRSAEPHASTPHGLSFAPQAGELAARPGDASVVLDGSTGTFVRVKPSGGGKPRVAVVDALADLNGDGRPDLVTVDNTSEYGDGIEVDGVTLYPAYAWVSLRRKNGTFAKRRLVYENDNADISSVAVGDVNGDHRPDLELAASDDAYGTSGVDILLGRGNGAFRKAAHLRTGGDPIAVAAVDVNGDGRRDVLTANTNGSVTVLLNRRGGSFGARHLDRIGAGATALAVGDLNGDRRPDLAVTRSASEVHAVTVLLNRGHGTFGAKRDYAVGNEPAAVTIGDLNGDGRPDIATANSASATVSVLLNHGGGTFDPRLDYATGADPFAVAVGRFDTDGRRDLVVPTQTRAEPVTVLVNTPGLCDVQDAWGVSLAAARRTQESAGCTVGTLTHAPSTGFAPGRVIAQTPLAGAVLHGGSVDLTVSDGPGPEKLAPFPTYAQPKTYPTPKGTQVVAIGDLNSDGKPDIVTGNCGNTVSVLLNKGQGVLAARTDYRVAVCSDAVKLVDLNGDGRPDIVSTGDDGPVSVLLNKGDGTFGPSQNYPSENGATYGTDYVAVVDVDGDGKPDLAILNGFEAGHGLTVFFGRGDGTFGSPRNYDLAQDAEAVVSADIDGDGKPDLAALDFAGVLELMNRGDGTLEQVGDYPAGGDGSQIFAGELTGDASPDLVVTYPDEGTVQVLLNEGAGALRPYVSYRVPTPRSVAIGDLNGDGTQDLAVAGKYLSILRNRGDGTFTLRHDYTSGPKQPRAVAIGDLNGDGQPDLVTADGTTVDVLLRTG